MNHVTALMNVIGREYAKTANGYYHAKAMHPDTIAHRGFIVPFIEALESDERFCVAYQDESQFRVNVYQNKAWIAESHAGNTQAERDTRFDARKSPGVGPGYSVTAAVVVSGGGHHQILRGANGDFVGHIMSTVGKASEKITDTHDTFLDEVVEMIEAQKAAFPGRVPVLVVDGAKTHTTIAGGRDGSSINLKPGGKNGGDNLQDLLRSVGIDPSDMKKDEAMKAWMATEESRSMWSEAEEAAAANGGILLYLPNAHPYFNPIECVWRACKQNYRRLGIKTMDALYSSIIECLQREDQECRNSLRRHHFYAQQCRRHLLANPEAEHLTENNMRSSNFVQLPVPIREVAKLRKQLGVVDTKRALTPQDVATFQRYAHWCNQVRIYGAGQWKLPKLSDIAPFDRNKEYPRRAKHLRHDVAAPARAAVNKEKATRKTETASTTKGSTASAPTVGATAKRARRGAQDDDDSGDDFVERGPQSSAHTPRPVRKRTPSAWLTDMVLPSPSDGDDDDEDAGSSSDCDEDDDSSDSAERDDVPTSARLNGRLQR